MSTAHWRRNATPWPQGPNEDKRPWLELAKSGSGWLSRWLIPPLLSKLNSPSARKIHTSSRYASLERKPLIESHHAPAQCPSGLSEFAGLLTIRKRTGFRERR